MRARHPNNFTDSVEWKRDDDATQRVPFHDRPEAPARRWGHERNRTDGTSQSAGKPSPRPHGIGYGAYDDGRGVSAEALCGRDSEVALLDEWLRDLGERGRALLVRGDPGIGKTALLDAAADAARSRGCRPRSGRRRE